MANMVAWTSSPFTISGCHPPFASLVWSAHWFFNSHQTITKDEFYALLSVADLAVVTPFRDGMNTTSMDYVIAQEKTNKSPLILSEFMGITNNMGEAMNVNPWNLGVRLDLLYGHPGYHIDMHRRMSRPR